MKKITVNGRTTKAFVLAESEKRIVYIDIKYLHRVDYERLKKIEQDYPKDMLEGMKKTRLSNGRNALVVYDNVINVYNKKAGVQIPKEPTPEQNEAVRKAEAEVESPQVTSTESDTSTTEEGQEEAPKPKKRGRPRKNQTEES